MHESFTGNRIVKAYNLEGVVSQQFRGETAKYISHFMRMVRSTETPGPLIEFMASIAVAALLFYFAVQSRPSVGDFAVFVLLIFAMYRPVKALVRLHSQVSQARAATERILRLLATDSTLRPPQPVPLQAAKAPIVFDNVTFGYGDKLVLHQISLSVEPGEMVALVGKSGSGKTTLANLLLRFYDPLEGSIRIGGVDLRNTSMRELRAQMAFVSRRSFFSMTPSAATSVSADPVRVTGKLRKPPGTLLPTNSSSKNRTAMRPSWAKKGPTFLAASGSAWPSPAPFCATRPSSSWTKRPARSTTNRNGLSRRPWTN